MSHTPNSLRIAIQFQHDLWRGHSNSAMAYSCLIQMAYVPQTRAVPQHLWRSLYPSCCEFISCAGIQRSLSRSAEHWPQPSQDWPWGSEGEPLLSMPLGDLMNRLSALSLKIKQSIPQTYLAMDPFFFSPTSNLCHSLEPGIL